MDHDQYEFYIRTHQTGVFKHLFETLKDILEDINIVITNEGIFIRETSKSQVVIANIHLKAKDLGDDGEYICNMNSVVGINAKMMNDALKIINAKEESIVMYKLKSDPGKLVIYTDGKFNRYQAVLSLLDVDKRDINVDNYKYDLVHELSSKEFQDMCKMFAKNDPYIDIHGSSDSIKFVSNGTIEITKMYSEIEGKEENTDWSVQSSFSIGILNSLTKATNVNQTMTLMIKKDAPLFIRYPVDNLGFLDFLLFPKSEE